MDTNSPPPEPPLPPAPEPAPGPPVPPGPPTPAVLPFPRAYTTLSWATTRRPGSSTLSTTERSSRPVTVLPVIRKTVPAEV
ncbi:hypothetical protein OHS18_17000 [Amycolatopsis sp. NBC_00355]|uniref:hypothetical protein n=1 Tax=Amycolatopsis sp. NBC_00355 TaxID=2975957 RepID=UPI002E2640B0